MVKKIKWSNEQKVPSTVPGVQSNCSPNHTLSLCSEKLFVVGDFLSYLSLSLHLKRHAFCFLCKHQWMWFCFLILPHLFYNLIFCSGNRGYLLQNFPGWTFPHGHNVFFNQTLTWSQGKSKSCPLLHGPSTEQFLQILFLFFFNVRNLSLINQGFTWMPIFYPTAEVIERGKIQSRFYLKSALWLFKQIQNDQIWTKMTYLKYSFYFPLLLWKISECIWPMACYLFFFFFWGRQTWNTQERRQT